MSTYSIQRGRSAGGGRGVEILHIEGLNYSRSAPAAIYVVHSVDDG